MMIRSPRLKRFALLELTNFGGRLSLESCAAGRETGMKPYLHFELYAALPNPYNFHLSEHFKNIGGASALASVAVGRD